MLDLGFVRPGATIRIPFNTFDSNDPSASVTVTGLAVTDIEIFKDGSLTQRASDAGYAVDTDVDTIAGTHWIEIDLSDNTTAGFFAAGSEYLVQVSSITVDAATINFWAGRFTIGIPGMLLGTTIAVYTSTDNFTLNTGSTNDDAYNGCILVAYDVATEHQMQIGVIEDYTGSTKTVNLKADPAVFTMTAADNIIIMPPALLPTTAGNTLDVTTTGAAGIDWGNVENPTTAVDLSGTDIQLVDTATTVTNGVTLAAGAVTDASLAGGLEIVFETDFATNYNTTRNAWATNAQDFVGTTASDPFAGQVVAASVTGAVGSVTAGVTLAATATSAQLVDDIMDEPLTAGTHNVGDSLGKRIRDLQEVGSVYGGYVWVDTNASNTNTDSYIDGTSDNPVSTIAAANTIAAAVGLVRYKIAPGSSITLAQAQTNDLFEGEEWTLALGGQNIAGSIFIGAVVSGIGTGSNPRFVDCEVGTATLADSRLSACALTGTLTFSAAGDYYLDACYSGVAGAGTPVIDFGAAVANTNLSMRHYSGGIQIDNKDNTGTDNMSLEGNGQLVVAASSGGAISIRGNFRVTNTGGATLTYDDNTQNTVDILADTNELQTDDIPSTLATLATAAALATVDTVVDNLNLGIIYGTAQTGTLSTTQMTTDLTGYADDELIGRVVVWTAGGTADGQASTITDSANASGLLTFNAVVTAPVANDPFKIV